MKKALLNTSLSSIFCLINPNIMRWYITYGLSGTPLSLFFDLYRRISGRGVDGPENKSRFFFSMKRPTVLTTFVKLMVKLLLE